MSTVRNTDGSTAVPLVTLRAAEKRVTLYKSRKLLRPVRNAYATSIGPRHQIQRRTKPHPSFSDIGLRFAFAAMSAVDGPGTRLTRKRSPVASVAATTPMASGIR
jgi:hypothetical protein